MSRARRRIVDPRMQAAVRLQAHGASRQEVLAMLNGSAPLPAKRPRAAPRQLEGEEQRRGLDLLRLLGAELFVRGHRRARPNPECAVCRRNMSTRQTPGIPDVSGFLPVRGTATWRYFEWEAKFGAGALTAAQRKYRDLCRWANVWHIAGDYNALVAALVEAGFLGRDQLPHYRQPPIAPSPPAPGS